ncbi:MAG TPA: colicin immunity domain-containing protein [Hymenobacter sp.]|jgi:hypothetical protein|uniref:colicin immunity domain-containing protein n=1 Tax=Hymenobacter sp. TaxID=1898978 RepID=UPI002ED86C65
MNEANYRPIIEAYLGQQLSVDAYITAFMRQWKNDRDAQQPTSQQTTSDTLFARMMDRLFTSCDCYDENPEGPVGISESTLRDEVALFHPILWD